MRNAEPGVIEGRERIYGGLTWFRAVGLEKSREQIKHQLWRELLARCTKRAC